MKKQQTKYEDFLDAALAFKKAKPWTRITSDTAYAVCLPSGKLVYCSLMGMDGAYIGLSVYQEGPEFQFYRKIIDGDIHDYASLNLLLNACIQCELTERDSLEDEEYDRIRDYTQQRNIRLRGAHAFPHMIRFTPWTFPRPILTDEEAIDEMIFCIRATTEKFREIAARISLLRSTDKIPLVGWNGAEYIVDECDQPEILPEEYPSPRAPSATRIKQLKKLPHMHTFQFDLFPFPFPMKNRSVSGGEPRMIAIPFVCDATTEDACSLHPIQGYDERVAKDLITQLVDFFVNGAEALPNSIQITNDRVEALLRPLCAATGIKLQRVMEQECLNKCFDDFIDGFINSLTSDDEDFDDEDDDLPINLSDPGKMDLRGFTALISFFNDASDEQLLAMPSELKTVMLNMMEQGVLPPQLTERLRRLLK